MCFRRHRASQTSQSLSRLPCSILSHQFFFHHIFPFVKSIISSSDGTFRHFFFFDKCRNSLFMRKNENRASLDFLSLQKEGEGGGGSLTRIAVQQFYAGEHVFVRVSVFLTKCNGKLRIRRFSCEQWKIGGKIEITILHVFIRFFKTSSGTCETVSNTRKFCSLEFFLFSSPYRASNSR